MPEQVNTGQRCEYLESLRGIASASVVTTHYASAFYPAAVFGSRYRLHSEIELLISTSPLGIAFSAHCAVCTFFVLSGFVLSFRYFGDSQKSSQDLLNAVVKRPFRLGGLVSLSMVLSALCASFGLFVNKPASTVTFSDPWFHDCMSRETPSLTTLGKDLFIRMFEVGPGYNPPLWTLQIELYGSFLTFAILLLFRKSWLRGLVYAYAAIVLHGTLYQGFLFGIAIADLTQTYSMHLQRRVFHLLSYPLLLGGLIAATYPNYTDPKDILLSMYANWPVLYGLGGGYPMLAAVLIFLALVLSPTMQRLLSCRILVGLGKISFALYTLHFLILASLASWLMLQFSQFFSYPISVALSTVLSVGFTVWVAYYATVLVDARIVAYANLLPQLFSRRRCLRGQSPRSISGDA